MEAFGGMLAPAFGNRPPDITEENIQSRIRGVTLMALSNKFGDDAADHRQQVRDEHRLRHASMATCAAAIRC